MDPNSMGDKQVIREDFFTTVTARNNGWILNNTVSNSILNSTGLGATKNEHLDWFWRNGGTVRVKFKFNETGVNSKAIFGFGLDANRLFKVLTRQSDGFCPVEIRLAAGNNCIKVIGTSTAGQWVDLVATYTVSTGLLTVYTNGVYADQSTTLAGATYADNTTFNTLEVGFVTGITSTTDTNIDYIELYRNVWTAEEVLDAYQKDTYSEINSQNLQVFLPLTSKYNDGTEKTENIGTGADCVVGDGSTATTFPTPLLRGNGMSFDNGDYIQSGTTPTTTGTLMCLFNAYQNTEADYFFGSLDAAGNRCYLGLNTGGGLGGGVGTQSAGVIKSASGILTTYQFYTGAMTWNMSGNVNLYLDGVNVYSGAAAGTISSRALIIGGLDNNGVLSGYIWGRMFTPLIDNKELSPMQIRFLHQKMFNTLNI